ncbi:uncharacterized protein [Branchiostoma lanceolatum]|uniref:uncharacterized protein n=1 Tax=Branchiostoma lanceolatum TaxID=7740 RepID=UPI0034520C40
MSQRETFMQSKEESVHARCHSECLHNSSQALPAQRMDTAAYNMTQLPSDVETDADPIPGSFMSGEIRTASSQPMAAEEKTARPSTMLVNGEQDKEAEYSRFYHSDPPPMSGGAVPFHSSREGGQSISSPAVHSTSSNDQNGSLSSPDARAPVQISSPSSEQAGGPILESRNLSRHVAAMKDKPPSFLSTEEEDHERTKSASLPYPSEEKGYDSGPELDDDEDVEYYDYFLVFSEKDKKHARRITDLLNSHKLKGCLLEKDFPAGASPFKNIADAIERSTYTVLVLTENFTKDRWCEKKLQTSLMEAIEDAAKYNSVIPIIPHPDMMPRKKLPSELKTVSALDMTNEYFDDKIKKTFKTSKREKRERELKRRREARKLQPFRSVCSVPSSLSSQTDFESLSVGKSSQSLIHLNRRYSSPVNGEKGKNMEEKSQRLAATRPTRGHSGGSIQSKKDAESGPTNGTPGNRMRNSSKTGSLSVERGSAHNQADEAGPCHPPDSNHHTPQRSAAHQPPPQRDNPTRLQQHDTGLSAKAEPQVAAKSEVGDYVWVEKCDGLSANSGRGDISSASGNSIGANQVKSHEDGGARDQNIIDQMSVSSKDKGEVPPSGQPLTDPSIPTSAADGPWKRRDGRPHDDQTPAETHIPRAGDGQAPGVGNIPVIACQPPVLPQPYQVTNVYNIYSPQNIQIGNQNAMEKDDIVTDGPGFDQPVYYVPPMPYPPNMAAAPMHAASPMAQGQENTKTSDDAARKLNKEYDIDDETDVKVPVEPEFDLDDETHVKIPVKPTMQTRHLSPAEISRSESCSSADEAQEETCVMSALAEDLAEDLSLNTTDGSTSVKEVWDLESVDEESMASGASVPKQRKGGNFFSFLSRGKKK